MRTSILVPAAEAILFSTVLSAPVAAAEPFFMGLGDLPGGGFSSFAYDVSADGSVVVGQGLSGSGAEAFRWTQGGGMVGLGSLPGGSFGSIAFGASADGSVIVGESGVWYPPPFNFGRLDAFRWTQSGGMEAIPFAAYGSTATDVSSDGSVVVGTGTTFPGRGNRPPRPPETAAFRWSEGSGSARLGDLPGGLIRAAASGVSANGSVVVGYGHSDSGAEAFRWTQSGGMASLGDLPGGGFSSMASAVSADGSAIVGYGSSASGTEAFRWTQGGGMVGLGILPGFISSRADDVSADGSVVVGWGHSASDTAAFLWDATHGMRSLRDVLVNDFGLGASLDGWNLEYARGISAAGRVVVGYGFNPNGDREAWIARLDSAPTLPGDFNIDGTVDAADYVVWRNNDGSQEGYSTWRANFGASHGGDSGAALPSAEPLSGTVPEPATALLMMIGGVIALASRSGRLARRENRFATAVTCERGQYHRSGSLRMAAYLMLVAATCVVVVLPTSAAAATYSFTNIADISGPFSGFRSLSINDNGTVAFGATLDVGGEGIFTGAGGPTTMVVDDSGQFSDFGNLIVPSGVSINNGGQVAFFASLDAGGWGIFTSSGGPVTTIADTNGPVSSFAGGSGPSINDSGTVGFVAGLDAGGAAVFTGNGGPLATIADSSGPGSFSQIQGVPPSLNNGGTVAFVANFNSGSGAERGIFTSSGGPATLIVDGRGPLFGGSFNSPPAVNDGGTVAYRADYDGAASGRGIFIGAGTTIADSSGPFSSSFGNKPAINNRDTVVFNAGLDAGGSGIFTGPDPVTDKVIRTGNPLFGSTATFISFGGELNDNGDIPFLYGLANGSAGIAVAQRQPNAPVPSPIPQPELRAEASAEFRANQQNGFTDVDFDTAGIPGRAEARANHSNSPTIFAYGEAFADVPVVPVTTDDLGKVGSRSYAESPLPGFPGGPIDSPTRANAQARQILKLTAVGAAPQIDIDMTVHFDGSLHQEVVPGTVVCETPCDPAPLPRPGDVTTSVSAEVNIYTNAGRLTPSPFEASARLDWTAGEALKLSATGPWATDFTPLLQPKAGVPGGASVSYTEFFDDMLFLAAGEEYTVEVVLRTEVFNHFISTRLGFVSIADFFNSGAVTFSTDTPGVTIELVPDGLQGDFNHDGTVDAADYVVWRKGVATGVYTHNDYNIWRANFGRTAGNGALLGSSSNTAVPEPAILVLLIFCCGWLLWTARPGRIGIPSNSLAIETRQQPTLVTHVF